MLLLPARGEKEQWSRKGEGKGHEEKETKQKGEGPVASQREERDCEDAGFRNATAKPFARVWHLPVSWI
jgi:hypothetical protein